MEQPWTPRQRPDRLERRIEFEDYDSTRRFLERLEELCQQQGRFPDISFGRTYVNLTVRPDGDGEPVGEADQSFAAAIDGLT